MSLSTFPRVAVVILNWNGKSFLEKYLPFVVASTYPNLQIVIADNKSTDDSVDFTEDHYPQIGIVVNSENLGYAGGYNAALKQVTADYFVLLNSDVEPRPDWLQPVIELMERDRTIAACQPKILDTANRDQFEYAGASGGFIDKLGYPFCRGRIFEHIEKDSGQYDDARECFWASGAALFVRASAFNEVGGFDESFFAHQEEIDLCWRLKLRGYKIFVEPKSVVYHVGGGTLQKTNPRKTFLNFRNNLRMLAKNLNDPERSKVLKSRAWLDKLAAFKSKLSGDIQTAKAISDARKNSGADLPKAGLSEGRPAFNQMTGVLNGSLLKQYYLKKRKRFSQLKF